MELQHMDVDDRVPPAGPQYSRKRRTTGNVFEGVPRMIQQSDNDYCNVVLAREIIAPWADYMQLGPRKGYLKNSYKHLYIG